MSRSTGLSRSARKVIATTPLVVDGDDISIAPATTTTAGSMSADDKEKLDELDGLVSPPFQPTMQRL